MKPVICLLIFTCGLHALPGEARATETDAELLRRHAVEPTKESLTSWLRELTPDEALMHEANRLIALLGDPAFSVREAAMQEILDLPQVPLSLLHESSASADLETAHRSQAILKDPKTIEKLHASKRKQQVTAAVLRIIRDQTIGKTTSAMLEIAPYLESRELVWLAEEAIAVVADSDDVPLLRKSIASEDATLRSLAIRGLGTALGASAKDELQMLCADADPNVVVSAAFALAEQSDRTALQRLIGLLSNSDRNVRVRSLQILRSWTQLEFAFDPYSERDDQQENLDRWTRWLSESGDAALLHLPIRVQPLPEDLNHGLLLHYTFDQDDASPQLRDESGHGKHASAQNAFALAPRGDGNALLLTGSGHHGDRGGHVILPFVDFSSLDEFTLAMWVKESGMTHEEGEAYITFGVDNGVGVDDAVGIAHFNHELIFRTGNAKVAIEYLIEDRDHWSHYAMTVEAGRLKAYRNGQLIGETEARISVTDTKAALGRHWWGGGAGTSSRFTGGIDDVRIYDHALTDLQLNALSKAGD